MVTPILLFGDVHGNFHHVIDIVRKERPPAIIFLGDLDCPRPLHELLALIRDLTDIWFIHGNHDTDNQEVYRNLFVDNELADKNLHGRVVEIAGVRVAGLGGVFRQDIWYPELGEEEPKFLSYQDYAAHLRSQRPTRLRSPDLNEEITFVLNRKHRSSIFYDQWFQLYGQQQADILVTHEAPHCHPHGFRAITALAQSLHAKFSFHGHHHDCLNYRAFDKEFGFSAFGVGFCGVIDQYGGQIAPGDFDEARRYRRQHTEE